MITAPDSNVCSKCGATGALNITYLGRVCKDCEKKIDPVCDFCNQRDVEWEYPVKTFEIKKLPGYNSQGNWLACVRCYNLVEASKWDELDSVLVDLKLSEDKQFELQTALHKQFRENRLGPAFRITYPHACDFCHSSEIRWRYPVKPFEQPKASFKSTDDWATCNYCHELIENENWMELLIRTVTSDPNITVISQEHGEDKVDKVAFINQLTAEQHALFKKNRNGPAVPYQRQEPKSELTIITPPLRASSNVDYMRALEVRAKWLQWTQTPDAVRKFNQIGAGPDKLREYAYLLERGDTFFMDAHFCSLVDHSRRSMPDDIKFEIDWVVRPYGWMYLAEPFNTSVTAIARNNSEVTGKYDIKIRAIGWKPIAIGMRVLEPDGSNRTVKGRETWFCCYIESGNDGGFRSWSYFSLADGEMMGSRADKFEAMTGDKESVYVKDMNLHEIRWVYAAMHLMSQRLAVTQRQSVDRPTRKRIQRERKQEAPKFIDVVTLRRLQADKDRDPKGRDVDWQWQWDVSGHWRNQWFPADGVHRRIFIDSYVKGDPTKPFKPSRKLFVATR